MTLGIFAVAFGVYAAIASAVGGYIVYDPKRSDDAALSGNEAICIFLWPAVLAVPILGGLVYAPAQLGRGVRHLQTRHERRRRASELPRATASHTRTP